jgi:hypothetical protein
VDLVDDESSEASVATPQSLRYVLLKPGGRQHLWRDKKNEGVAFDDTSPHTRPIDGFAVDGGSTEHRCRLIHQGSQRTNHESERLALAPGRELVNQRLTRTRWHYDEKVLAREDLLGSESLFRRTESRDRHCRILGPLPETFLQCSLTSMHCAECLEAIV